MDDATQRHATEYPLRAAQGMRRVVVALQALLVVAVGEALVFGVVVSDGSSISSRPNEIALIVSASVFVLAWLGAVLSMRRRAPRFAVVVSDTGVDLPSMFRARRVCVSWADLVSVTEQRTGAITWVHRVTTARGTTRARRLVTGPRVDSASLFATLDRFRARHGHRFTLEGPGVEPGT